MIQRHVINRQICDLVVPEQERAHELQEEAKRVLFTQVSPVLDELFTSLTRNGEVIRLDRLEVDIGVLAAGNLEDQLSLRIKTQVEAALSQEIDNLKFHPREGSYGKIFSAEESDLQAFREFLETGTLPWWFSKDRSAGLDSWLVDLIGQQPLELTRVLHEAGRPLVVQRIVKQFSVSCQSKLLKLLSGPQAQHVEDLLNHWHILLEQVVRQGKLGGWSRDSKKEISDFLHKELFHDLMMVTPYSIDLGDLSRRILARLILQGGEKSQNALSKLLIHVQRLPEDHPLRRSVEHEVQHLAQSTREHDRPKRLEDRQEENQPFIQSEPMGLTELSRRAIGSEGNVLEVTHESLSEGQRFGTQMKESSKAPPAQDAPQVSEAWPLSLFQSERYQQDTDSRESDASTSLSPSQITDDHYISNAGLVLLWPFLKNLFTSLDLLDKNTFHSQVAQERAVLLLQHLVTGEVEWAEPELLLNKLLSGWELQQPVSRAIQLTESERQESQELLSSVIGHWAVLKKTSIPSFRQSFLQREGRLTEQEHGWHLTIPRAGYDVLLDRLPWGIGFVLLPWMKTPLSVEW